MNVGLVSESCGDLLDKNEFISYVRCGGFIDYDGFGRYSDGVYEYDEIVKPSKVLKDGWNKKYTHVVWYNR